MPAKVRQVNSKANSKRRVSSKLIKIHKRPTRKLTKPMRYGSRVSSGSGDDFFERLIEQTQTSANNVTGGTTASERPILVATQTRSDSIITLNSTATSNENSTEPNNSQNALTDALNSSSSSNSMNVHEVRQSTPNSSRSTLGSIGFLGGDDNSQSFESVVRNGLSEILIRLGQLEKHVAKLDARIVDLSNDLNKSEPVSKTVTKIKSIEQKDLLQFGLPVNSSDALNKLEDNLSKTEFLNSVVSVRSEILLNTIN